LFFLKKFFFGRSFFLIYLFIFCGFFFFAENPVFLYLGGGGEEV